MKLKSIIKFVARAAPVVIAHAPAVIAAVRDAKKAKANAKTRHPRESGDPDEAATTVPHEPSSRSALPRG